MTLCVAFMQVNLYAIRAEKIPLINIDNQFTESFLGPGILVCEDKAGTMKAHEVLAGKTCTFKKSKRRQPHFGVSSSSFWILFKVKNLSEHNTEFFLKLSHSAADLFELYLVKSGVAAKISGYGAGYTYLEREIDSRLPVLELKIPQAGTQTFLVKMKSPKYALMSFRLQTSKEYFRSENTWQLISAFGGGFFFSLFLYNLVLLILVREKLYLFYIIYLSGNILSYLCYEGYIMRYLLRDAFQFNNFGISAGSLLALGGMICYIMEVLDIRKSSVMLFRTGSAIMVCCLILIPAFLILSESFYNQMLFVAYFPILFFGLILIGNGLKQNHFAGRFMAITFSLLLSERLIQFLGIVEFIPSGDYSYLMSKLGSWLEMSLMALLTGWKMRAYQKERNRIEEIAGRQAILAAQSESRAERLKLENLKSTIQPHFLFNTLGSLKGWLHENPQKADSLLSHLANELRFIYEVSEKQLIPLRREIEICRTHIEVMNMRLERKSRLIVKGDITGIDIPPLIIHTIIENGYSHGIAKQKKINFSISVQKNISGFTLEIKTPLGKRKPSVEEGTGFRYIRARLDEVYRNRYKMLFTGNNDFFISVITIFSNQAGETQE